MKLKDRINKVIVEQKITGAQFATTIGVQKSAIYNILRGKTKKMTPDTANKIVAKYPEYTYSWLMDRNADTTDVAVTPNTALDEAAQVVANNFEAALESNRVLFLEVERYSRDYLIKRLEEKDFFSLFENNSSKKVLESNLDLIIKQNVQILDKLDRSFVKDFIKEEKTKLQEGVEKRISKDK